MRLARIFNRLKRPKVFIPLVLLILILAATAAIIKNLNAPAVGSVSQSPPTRAEQIDPYAQPGTYKGKYISFKYPAHFKKMPSKKTGSILEVADYHTVDISGKQISTGVYRDSIAANSGVKYRRQNSALYKETDSHNWVEFTKTDGTEDTFYLEHNGLLASVSATAPNGRLNKEALFVASGLKWLVN